MHEVEQAVEGLASDDFRQAFRSHPAGVAVITADDGGGPVGLTATSVFSVSAEPPLFSFSLSSASPTAQAIANADTLVIHLLGVEQREIAQLFSSRGADRFGDTRRWARLGSGEPYLVDAPIWVRGRVVERLRMQAGASIVIACHALEAHFPAADEYSPLVYHDRAWHQLGAHSRLPD
ncbi:flavin reductase family protein [Pseudomonas putida]|uniref:Flavin reductase family protein n=1 Tax=Pseudomonas putida TaxID=303 RepID=A0A4D6X9K1_PSEPU|nr:flavin reductase family protein [Pseudomonas putida]QCI13506.1 flavin reductase family protein [Pseudomonas putida]